MDSKHTPGPWVVDGDVAAGEALVGPEEGREVAQLIDRTHPLPEREANARLIAAAPDMLAALKALLEWGREHTSPRDPNSPHDILVAAAAAIARAEGR